jgi:hypothetical protein
MLNHLHQHVGRRGFSILFGYYNDSRARGAY